MMFRSNGSLKTNATGHADDDDVVNIEESVNIALLSKHTQFLYVLIKVYQALVNKQAL